MFVHHFLLISVAIAIKELEHGDNVWIYTFTYAEIPTFVLHFSWFIRNIANNTQEIENCMVSNLQTKIELISRVNSDQNNNNKNSVDNINLKALIKKNWKLASYYQNMKTAETLCLLIFAAIFLYVREWVHLRVYIPYMYCSIHSPLYTNFYSAFCVICGISLCVVNILWGLKIVVKAKRDLLAMYKRNALISPN